ncbi:MAG: hypothetical protein WB581_08640 [Halobacteriota archaeon]
MLVEQTFTALVFIFETVSPTAGHSPNVISSFEFINRSEKDPKRITKAAMPEEKYGAHSVRPCKGGGILVEGTFDKPFSMEILCRILRDTEGKCAEKLGVARLFYGGCGITLYRNGRVDVHRVQSTEEAIEILDEVKVIVGDAFVQGD